MGGFIGFSIDHQELSHFVAGQLCGRKKVRYAAKKLHEPELMSVSIYITRHAYTTKVFRIVSAVDIRSEI